MNLGSSVDDLGLVILLIVPALLAPAMLLGLGALLARIFRLPPAPVALGFTALVVGGIILGGSLYLDQAGRTSSGIVERKDDGLRLRRQGDWQHRLSITVRYRLDGSTPVVAMPSADDSAVGLDLSAAQFDQLRAGEPVQLKTLALWRSLALVRLASSSTGEWVNWGLVGGGLGLLGLGGLAFALSRVRGGCLGMLGLGLMVSLIAPPLLVYRDWQALEDLAAKPLRAEATVREITRVTQINPLPCAPGGRRCSGRGWSEFDAPQQYDIVELVFTPESGRDLVVAVDAADVGSAQLERGASLPIAYAAADPRAAQIVGATHTHRWKNMVSFGGILLSIVLTIGALLGAGLWFGRRRAGKQP